MRPPRRSSFPVASVASRSMLTRIPGPILRPVYRLISITSAPHRTNDRACCLRWWYISYSSVTSPFIGVRHKMSVNRMLTLAKIAFRISAVVAISMMATPTSIQGQTPICQQQVCIACSWSPYTCACLLYQHQGRLECYPADYCCNMCGEDFSCRCTMFGYCSS